MKMLCDAVCAAPGGVARAERTGSAMPCRATDHKSKEGLVIRTVARFAAVTATSVTMLALLPAAASANVTFHAGSIQYANKAALQEDSTVLITFTYQCVPGFEFKPEEPTGFIRVFVHHPESYGFAASPATWDDRKHTVTLDIWPGPFKTVSAFTDAPLFNSNSFSLDSQPTCSIN